MLDPATGEAFGEAPDQRPDELDDVVARAHEAWRGWRSAPAARATALLASADAVEAAGAELAPLLTREQGKPWPSRTPRSPVRRPGCATSPV